MVFVVLDDLTNPPDNFMFFRARKLSLLCLGENLVNIIQCEMSHIPTKIRPRYMDITVNEMAHTAYIQNFCRFPRSPTTA